MHLTKLATLASLAVYAYAQKTDSATDTTFAIPPSDTTSVTDSSLGAGDGMSTLTDGIGPVTTDSGSDLLPPTGTGSDSAVSVTDSTEITCVHLFRCRVWAYNNSPLRRVVTPHSLLTP